MLVRRLAEVVQVHVDDEAVLSAIYDGWVGAKAPPYVPSEKRAVLFARLIATT